MSIEPIATIAGKYSLLERISEGGQGEVWLGRDGDGNKVAIKLIARPRSEPQRDNVRRRFTDEVEAGTALQSPYICRILASGEIESLPELVRPDGVFYTVMQYVAGGSLEDLIVSGVEFELDSMRKLVRGLCSALEEAHCATPRIVHRDIKPANILLHDGRLEEPRLADFGLARAEGGTRLTATGVTVGTAFYMPPEQMLGSSDVTPAADQYSLALVLCELLTNEVPGATGDMVSTFMQRSRGVDAPDVVIEGETAHAIRGVLQKAISADPDARYQSISAFADAFDAAGLDDGWWEHSVDTPGVSLESMPLFVIDLRPEGGALWVGGYEMTIDRVEALFGTARWQHVEQADELGGMPGFRARSDVAMPWVRGRGDIDVVPRKSRAKKPKAPPRGSPSEAFMRPLMPSPELAKVVGSKPLPRTEVVKKLWAYIKKHGLQDSKNLRMINADSVLLPIFGGKKRLSMFDMTKLVSAHLAEP